MGEEEEKNGRGAGFDVITVALWVRMYVPANNFLPSFSSTLQDLDFSVSITPCY